jgi:hypothetical protein
VSSPTSFPAAVEAPELPALPVPQQLVEEMLRHLARAVKTHQLYLPNNPIYQRAIETLRGAFVPIWAGTTELVLHISESEFRWLGRTVQTETMRTESLPWLFFKDGVRELTFRQGVEKDELLVLLDILQRVRKASPEEDDLLTLLWEQEFAYLRYRFIDIAIDGVVPPAPSEAASAERSIPLVEVQQEVEEEQAPERQGIVRMDDFDATLYFLDEHEIDYLRAEVQKEQSSDLRRNVIAILLDVLEVQSAPAVRAEVADILEQFILHLLSTGDYAGVAYLLGEVEALLRTMADASVELRARLTRLPESLSDAGVLSQLLQSLDDSAKIPPQEELDALFQQLRPATLGTVLGWLRQAQTRELRTALERTAARMASMNTAEMLKLIASDDPHIALEAIRRAADLRSPAAVANLAKVVGSGASVELRQAAAQALA